jgi:2-(1,2-epoxy-1,2-dihydrophenyl)acetyl-CoA isomerase
MRIEVKQDGPVTVITLNRPEALNAIDEDMKRDLIALFSKINADETVRSVVLRGAGRAFCAGGDVSTMGKFTADSIETRLRASHEVIKAICTARPPVIASMRGPVAGIGWSIAMACDELIASGTAYFCQSFRNIGVVPDGGALHFLAQNIGVVRAKELVFSGRRVPAEEARSLGLLTSVVDDATLDDYTLERAHDLAKGPTRAFDLVKGLMMELHRPLDDFLEAELRAQTVAVLTNDHKEGVAAFRDKRPPSFLGH